uniref:Uncharacterized protein n=1 Tax=Anopheles albimanus TaxID=7167 RepID=A0A182FZ80_ANOAL
MCCAVPCCAVLRDPSAILAPF